MNRLAISAITLAAALVQLSSADPVRIPAIGDPGIEILGISSSSSDASHAWRVSAWRDLATGAIYAVDFVAGEARLEALPLPQAPSTFQLQK